MKNITVLLVEDDQTLGYILTEYLEMKEYQVVWAKNGKEGLKKFRSLPVSLCLLDVMMPEMDGFDLAKSIRDQDARIPIIFLTARSMKIDKLKGFNLGADDYISKPVDEEELLARMEAVLRRSLAGRGHRESEAQILPIGRYLFDVHKRFLTIDAKQVSITEKEAQLLELLARNKNQLVLRSEALKKIWGNNDYFTRKSMDVHIHKLRKLLNNDPRVAISNVHGKGFILATNTES